MRHVAVGGASAVTLAMAALCAAPAVAANGCAAPNAAQQVVCTYTTPSATPYTLTLPPAVDLLSLDIYGAQGGDAGSASGGLGARANGLWNLDGGPTSLEIAVGGRGVGLAGGGPNGGYGRARTGSVPGGGGGGSSTVVADGVVLGIAAGGGGAAHPPPGSATGAAGGNAGSQGGDGAVVGIARGGGGGQAATHLTPGAAGGFVSGSLCGSGVLDFPATAGLSDGHGGLGGMAFYDVPGGGGGGGGLAGGGGGGGGESCSYRDQDTGNWVTRGGGGGGGGGGSSYAGGGGAESTAVYDGRSAPRHGDGTVTVRFTVPPNYAPTAGSDVFAVSSGARFRIPAPGVLANDDDRNLDSLSAVLVTQPGHGTVTLADDGSLTYEFPRYFSGTETFTYRATDGDAQSAPATVTLHVTGDTPPPPPPTPPPPDGPVPPRPDEPRAAAADLALTIRAPARTRVGRRATYRIRVRNIGPSRATGVTATVRLPRRLRLLRDGRSCKTRGKARRTVTCRLPALAASKAADLRFVTRAVRRGPARISAQVRGAETDPRSTNNTVRVATRLQRHRRR